MFSEVFEFRGSSFEAARFASVGAVGHGVSGDRIQQALADIFGSQGTAVRRVIRIERESSAYHSSFPLEELTLWFENGEPLKLVFENLHPLSLSVESRRAQPLFLADPLREIELYHSVLDTCELGTPFCYGSIADPDTGRYWLFLEKVAGRELYQVGEFEIWRQASRWLAGLHSRYTEPDSVPMTAWARLIQYDAPYQELWQCSQWLRRSGDWSPPREHRQDWLSEAVESANRLRT